MRPSSSNTFFSAMINRLAKEHVLSLAADVLLAKSKYLLVEISDFKLGTGRL